METNGGMQAHALAADMMNVTAVGSAEPVFERIAVTPDLFGVERFVTAYKRN